MSLFALRPRSLFLTAFTLALAACGGGGDDDAAAGGGAGSGKLTLSASSPAVHDGDIDVATAQTKENVASPADAAIGVPYCAVRMERRPVRPLRRDHRRQRECCNAHRHLHQQEVSDAGNPANVTTINGSFSFPASTVAACGV
jgi:hypothetical protein